MQNIDLDATKKLGLTDFKKYWQCVSLVKIELDWLHNWILVLAICMRHSCKGYDNKAVTENIKIKQDINSEKISSVFN